MARVRQVLPAIGWREWLALPDLGVGRIKAKVDTGARSSALHAFDVGLVHRRGLALVEFKLHPLQRDSGRTVYCVAELVDERKVRTSGGHEVLRPVIRTAIELAGQNWPIEITLADRDVMGFRMLLGRQAIRGRFVVDPARSFLGRRRARRAEEA